MLELSEDVRGFLLLSFDSRLEFAAVLVSELNLTLTLWLDLDLISGAEMSSGLDLGEGLRLEMWLSWRRPADGGLE